MSVNPVGMNSALNRLAATDNALGKGEGAGKTAEGMSEMLNGAIDALDESQKAADQGVADLVAGEPVELHQVMLEVEQSIIKMNLALQVRNKVIEAYQEIQRMQV